MSNGWRITWASVVLALVSFLPQCALAEEELIIDEEATAKPSIAAAIRKIEVVPVGDRIEVRVQGSGALDARIMVLKAAKKLVLDFSGVKYRAPTYALRAPGLGDIRVVRGGQFKPAIARVVVELRNMIKYRATARPGRYVLSLATSAEAEDEPGAGAPRAGKAAPVAKAAEPRVAPLVASAASPGARARVLHAMVTELPDRVRLVVTADGVFRYKLASRNKGKELELSLYDVDLKWSPPRLKFKEGPIVEVRARKITKPSLQVRFSIKLREPRPYYVRRDQNQVVVEVERSSSAEVVSELDSRRGNLNHKVTMNIQDEDLRSLIKALGFEAGFDNIVILKSVIAGGVTLSLRDVPFSKAMSLILAPQGLIWRVERGVLKVGTETEFNRELELAAISGGVSGGGGGGGGIVTRVFRLKYIALMSKGVPSSVEVAVRGILVSKIKGVVIVDQRANALIVTDVASNMSKVQSLIDRLDFPVPQVMIKARLVQFNRDRKERFGIDWTGERATPANPTLIASAVDPSPERLYTLTTGLLGAGFNLDATLDLLRKNDDVELLMNPSIRTLQDHPAIVETTETQSFRQVQQETLADGRLRITETYVPVPIPMTLKVTAHVNPDRTVRMDVEIKNTTARETVAGPPDTIMQTASTQLVVRDGETGVIGGILRDRTESVVTKVPLLGSLPWFLGGVFFRHTSMETRKLELVLFLTPTILDPGF